MTASEIPLDGSEVQPSTNPLVRWSEGLALWQRDALRRIAQHGNLTDQDKEELKTALFSLHDLDTFTGELVPLSAEHCKVTDFSAERHILCSIGSVKNVNRLAEDQPPLRFTPNGITLIYGDNASGKSGYGRIANKVCRARVDDEILGNAFSEEKQGEPAATIRWRVDSDPEAKDFEWSPNRPAPSGLATISVFDSRSAERYVDGDNQLDYLPFEVDLARQLTELCGEFGALLTEEIKRTQKSMIELPVFTPETPVSALIGRIASCKSAKNMREEAEIEGLAAWEESDETNLRILEKEVKDDPTHQANIRARCIGACESISDSLADLEKTLSEASANDLKAKRDALVAARGARDAAAAKEFDDMPLDHVGSDAWRSLFEHAKAYAELIYPEQAFPVTDDDARCVLCQQELDEQAKRRFVRFDEFVKNKAAQEFRERSESLTASVTALHELKTPDIKDIRQKLVEFANLSDERAAVLESLVATFEGLAKRKEALLSAAAGGGSFDGLAVVLETSSHFKSEIEKLRSEEEALRKSATDDEVRQAKVRQLAAMADRRKLHENLKNTLRYRTDRVKLLLLEACQSDVSTAGLSREVTRLRKKHFTEKLNDEIMKEIRGLGLTYLNVTIKDRTDKGTSEYWSDVGIKHREAKKKAMVLSEGEQRALSLACFLGETNLNPTRNGLIIDDPVSSLDQERIRRVAKRLVKAAKDGRQVVVFTHNLVFYQEVRSEAAEAKADLATHVIRSNGGNSVGIVKEEELPRLARRIKERLPALQDKLKRAKSVNPTDKDAYREAVERFYSELRETWERLVEETLLGGVVERFNSGVKTQSLKGVTVENADYHTIYHAMKRASEYSGHDRPLPKDLALPDHAELEDDLNMLIKYRKSITGRRKILEDERKDLEEAPKAQLE